MEQPLPPYGACLLGSINIASFVEEPLKKDAWFNEAKFAKSIRVFTRLLDNVVDVNNLPLEQQRREIEQKRRHGMGITGLGSALALLGIAYNSPEAVEFTSFVCKTIAVEGLFEGAALAKEKGCAPLLENEDNRYDWLDSRYLEQILREYPDLHEDLENYGCRFTHHSSIAPTGTISLSVNNNVSNGIEPSFSHIYFRNIIKEGRNTKEQQKVYSYEALVHHNMFPGEDLPDYFRTAQDIPIKAHVDIQAAAQKWIDSSISKTINVPTECSFEEFKDIYMYAYDSGLKGCTTFRFNPEVFQGVLVTEDNLKETWYSFTLADGSVVKARGGDKIKYEGEVTTAANLFDALKEGYYGRF